MVFKLDFQETITWISKFKISSISILELTFQLLNPNRKPSKYNFLSKYVTIKIFQYLLKYDCIYYVLSALYWYFLEKYCNHVESTWVFPQSLRSVKSYKKNDPGYYSVYLVLPWLCFTTYLLFFQTFDVSNVEICGFVHSIPKWICLSKTSMWQTK